MKKFLGVSILFLATSGVAFAADNAPVVSSDTCECQCIAGTITEDLVFKGRTCRNGEDMEGCRLADGTKGKKRGCDTSSEPTPTLGLGRTPLDILNQLVAPIN